MEEIKKDIKKNNEIDIAEAIIKSTKRKENRHEEVQQVISIIKKLLAIFNLKLDKRIVVKDLETGKKYY